MNMKKRIIIIASAVDMLAVLIIGMAGRNQTSFTFNGKPSSGTVLEFAITPDGMSTNRVVLSEGGVVNFGWGFKNRPKVYPVSITVPGEKTKHTDLMIPRFGTQSFDIGTRLQY